MESQVTQPGSGAENFLISRGASRRAFKDKATQIGVSIGGTMVFVALLLIFFYLLYVIKPIFDSATVEPVTTVTYDQPAQPSLMVGSDEQNEVMYRVSNTGEVNFYHSKNNSLIQHFEPKLPAGV